jgi:DNA-binding transcriptional regulator LsrR (DeoR family)
MSKEDDIRLDQKVRAAWMYYIAGQNQSEIASQLGTSRPVVQRLIAAAKEEGIVSISLHHPVANCLDYAQLLQEKYRLIECNIVPAFNEESTLDSVSFGCYQLMARYLQDDKEKIIGLGSGLTLKKALQRIDFDSLNTRCVALISAMDADGQCNYYDDVPLLLTSKIKAKYYQWPAPRYAQTRMSTTCGAPAGCFAAFRRRPPGGRYFCRHWAIRYPKPHLQRRLYQSGADG